MKKNGFTLTETLITLGIIGIAATLISPIFKHLIPNKDKMEFMECYKQLTTALPLIHSYYIEETAWDEKTQTFYPICTGLACMKGSENCDGEGKIGCIINELVGIEDKYLWSGTSDIVWSETPMPPKYPEIYKYAKKHEIICKSPNSTFKFILNGNGSIKELDSTAESYIKDQFNFYNN